MVFAALPGRTWVFDGTCPFNSARTSLNAPSAKPLMLPFGNCERRLSHCRIIERWIAIELAVYSLPSQRIKIRTRMSAGLPAADPYTWKGRAGVLTCLMPRPPSGTGDWVKVAVHEARLRGLPKPGQLAESYRQAGTQGRHSCPTRKRWVRPRQGPGGSAARGEPWDPNRRSSRARNIAAGVTTFDLKSTVIGASETPGICNMMIRGPSPFAFLENVGKRKENMRPTGIRRGQSLWIAKNPSHIY